MKHALSAYSYLTYAFPVVTTVWLMAPIGVLQGIYAKYYGVPLTTIASALLFTRLFDAILDPLIGYCADSHFRHSGSYKPFVFTGGLLFLVASFFLYVPPTQVTGFYLTAWLFTFYFSWTLFEMPHLAMASELAETSESKTLIYSFRSMAGYAGVLVFYAIPFLPTFETHAITPETLKVSVIAASILLIFFLIVFMTSKSINSQLPDHRSVADSTNLIRSELTRNQGFPEFLLSVVNNKPLMLFISIFILISISNGMWYGLIFLYVDAYLGLGAQFAKMFLLAYAVGILATPIWCKLALWLGKKTMWTLATSLLMCSYIYTGFLSPDDSSFTKLVAIKTIQTLGFAGIGVVMPAALSEIIDYGNLKYRTGNNATYFAIYTFVGKTTLAIATSVALGIAGWYGFDASVTQHSNHSIFGLTLAIAWLPSFFVLLALLLIFRSPINKHRHGIIRRRLDARSL